LGGGGENLAFDKETVFEGQGLREGAALLAPTVREGCRRDVQTRNAERGTPFESLRALSMVEGRNGRRKAEGRKCLSPEIPLKK